VLCALVCLLGSACGGTTSPAADSRADADGSLSETVDRRYPPLPDATPDLPESAPDLVIPDLPHGDLAELPSQEDVGMPPDLQPDLPPEVAPEEVDLDDCPDLAALGPGLLSGMLYRDGDTSSASLHSQGYFPKFDDPIGGWTVRLLGYGVEWETASCGNGEFHFSGLDEGTYVFAPEAAPDTDCTSNNLPRRFPEAVREGHVTLVTIGDSVPKVGPKPFFPARTAWMVRRVAEVENRNVAVPGTTTIHWLPGGNLFETVLAPELPEADVVVISVGGNDVMGFIGGALGNPSRALIKLQGLEVFTQQVHDNVATIITEIQARAPHVDVVFCLYVNYAATTYWGKQAGPYADLLKVAGHNVLVKARGLLAAMPGVLIADMFGAWGDASADPLLIDSVHLSAAGHALYAEEIFKVLGGTSIGLEPMEPHRLYGFAW
jgi:lysophospholipase L1-like esterase